MPARRVTEHVYAVLIGDVQVFIIVLPESLILIDAGFPGIMPLVEEAVRGLGRSPEEISDVLVTHCHPDHVCGLAEIVARTGARVWMSPEDAEMVRAGRTYRPVQVTPGDENLAFYREVIEPSPHAIEPVSSVETILPGEEVPNTGGIRAVGAPGHTAGHLAFLWPGDGGVLFVGDAAKNAYGLGPSPIYEDRAEGLRSMSVLAAQDFRTVCFGHGEEIVDGAAERLRTIDFRLAPR